MMNADGRVLGRSTEIKTVLYLLMSITKRKLRYKILEKKAYYGQEYSPINTKRIALTGLEHLDRACNTMRLEVAVSLAKTSRL